MRLRFPGILPRVKAFRSAKMSEDDDKLGTYLIVSLRSCSKCGMLTQSFVF